MVNLLGWRVHTFRKANFTQLVLRSIAVPDAFPCPSVPTLGGRVTVVPFIALGFQLLVFGQKRRSVRLAAGKEQGRFGFMGIPQSPPGIEKASADCSHEGLALFFTLP